MDTDDFPCFPTEPAEADYSDLTLRTVVQLIGLSPLTKTQKRDLTSGIIHVGNLLSPIGLDWAADLAAINAKLKGFTPAMAGMSAQTFANWKSYIRRAFKLAGLTVQPGKNTGPLPEVWEKLLAMIPDGWDRRRLGRFTHFAAQQGWQPDDITTEHMLRYLSMLEYEAISGNGRESYIRTCNRWNKQVETVPGWPGKTVEIVRKRDPYLVKPEDLPPSLRAEIDAFLDILAGGGPAIDGDAPVFLQGITRRSLSPVTIALRRTQIMQYVSALVVEGYSLDTLISVDAITSTKAIADAMNFFFHRAADKMPVQIQFIALAVRALLYHHLSGRLRRSTRQDKNRPLPPTNTLVDPRIALLDQVIAESRPTDRGMVVKNKRCLNQFSENDLRNTGELLHLPARLLKEAAKAGGKDGARLAEVALAIEFLLMCPIRIGNLVGLDLDRHLIKSRPGNKSATHIVIPKGEVKNKREIEFELPAHLANMLDRHIMNTRPSLPGAGSTWLFPSSEGGPRLYKLMARQISGIIRTRTGLKITPHQFRHIGGKFFLDAHPTGHETVRQVLGHASIDTTTQHYTGINQVKAGRTYDKGVLALREKTKSIISKRRS